MILLLTDGKGCDVLGSFLKGVPSGSGNFSAAEMKVNLSSILYSYVNK